MNAMTKLAKRLADRCNADFEVRSIRGSEKFQTMIHSDGLRLYGAIDEVVVIVFTGEPGRSAMKYEMRFAAPDARLAAPEFVVVAAINAAIECMGEPVAARWQDG
jgi:hypothetical protein